MTERNRRILHYLFSIALTAGFLYAAFRGTDLGQLASAIASADYLWLFVMFLLLMLSHCLRSWRWRYLLEPIKPAIGFRNLFSGVMVGYFINNILPRAGELVRPYTLGKLESVSRSSALGTIVVERMMDTATFLFLLAIIPVVYDGHLRDTFPWLGEAGIILMAIMTGIFVVITLLMVRRDMTNAVVSFLSKVIPTKGHARFAQVVHAFLDGFLFLKRPGNFLVIFLLSAGVWLLYIAMTKAAFHALHLEQQLGWRASIVVLAISSIGIAVPTPGSTGGYHFFTAQTLTRLFLVPEETALGFATLTHGVGYIGVTLVGLYFFIHDHVRISEAVKTSEERTT
jgi:uncharacterized protein (TIRG00374 family)